MTKRHLKRVSAPKTWLFPRKEQSFIARPQPGKHSLRTGIPMSFLLIQLLNVAKTRKEVQYILAHQDVLVDNKRIHGRTYNVGLLDTITLPKISKAYRILIDEQGNLYAKEIKQDEANEKTTRIIRKHKHKGKIQLTLLDGRTLLLDEKQANYAVGDSLTIELPSQKIKGHIPLKQGTTVLLIGGTLVGREGKVEEIKGKDIIFSLGKEHHMTRKKHALPIAS